MRFNSKIYKAPFLSFAFLPKIYRDHSVYDRIKHDDDDDDRDTGWKRLKGMYTIDDRGLPGPQFETVSQAMLVSFLASFAIGGIKSAKETKLRFIEENKITAFASQTDAKRKLQDKVTLSLFRGGWKRGWRISLVTGSILTILFSLETYKGYTSFLDFTVAGALPCGFYNFLRGPKPFISGLFVGGTLGTIAGVLFLPILKLTGVTLKDIYKMDIQSLDMEIEKEERLLENKRVEIFKNILPYRRSDGFSLTEAFENCVSEEEQQTKDNDSKKK